jgi:hypothetical protein|nr:MAG TPA: hypothetical protein [Caudoviricetes sp.]
MDFVIFYIGMATMTIIILHYASRGKNKLKNKDMFITAMLWPLLFIIVSVMVINDLIKR